MNFNRLLMSQGKLFFYIPILFLSMVISGCSRVLVSSQTPLPVVPTNIQTATSSTPALPGGLSLKTDLLKESSSVPAYTILAVLPSLQGNDSDSVLQFNNLVGTLLRKDVDTFRSDLLANPPNPPTYGSSYESTYAVFLPVDGLISLKFFISTYYDGAAHPGDHNLTFTYDLLNGQQVNLGSLFLPGSDYLKLISDYCKGQLALRDIAYSPEGAETLAENYLNWNITSNGLLITFETYQVAAYAAGPQTVLVPYELFDPILNPQGVLSRLKH